MRENVACLNRLAAKQQHDGHTPAGKGEPERGLLDERRRRRNRSRLGTRDWWADDRLGHGLNWISNHWRRFRAKRRKLTTKFL
jgi:hypothetical protein